MPPEFRIFETNRFLRDLQTLAPNRVPQIEKKLREYIYPQLRQEPHWGLNVKRLKDWEPPTWRYRVGDWRFFCLIDETEKTVSMVAASHRKEAYRS